LFVTLYLSSSCSSHNYYVINTGLLHLYKYPAIKTTYLNSCHNFNLFLINTRTHVLLSLFFIYGSDLFVILISLRMFFISSCSLYPAYSWLNGMAEMKLRGSATSKSLRNISELTTMFSLCFPSQVIVALILI